MDDRPDWRNRKGFVSQNCLFGCSFDVTFVYSLNGWEGSEKDARVYEDARSHDLEIPEDKYYLADAGYPLSNEFLVPYRGVQYRDLAEFGSSWDRYSISSSFTCLKAMCSFVDLCAGPPTKKNFSTSVMHQRAR